MRKNVFYALVASLNFLCLCAFGQSGFTTLGGANTVGIARAGSTLTGIAAIYTNPAGLAEAKNWAFDASVEQRFGIADLRNISMAVAKNTSFGTFALLGSQFGYSEFNEQKMALAYARKLSTKVNIGGQFDLLRTNIATLDAKTGVTFEVGAQVQISKVLKLGTHIFSPGNVKLSDLTTVGTRFRIGLQYHPSTKVALIGEVDKLEYRPLEYKLAVMYQPSSAISIRLGASPSTQSYGFGLGYTLNEKYHVHSAYLSHQTLGGTPAFSIQYQDK
jgi:hypothetical protein